MTALLGLLAVAGYQNREKIAEMLRGVSPVPDPALPTGTGSATTGSSAGRATGSPLDSILGGLKSAMGGAAGPGAVVGGGLGELVDRFRQTGHAETVDSWVGTGTNREVAPPQLEQAIGSDVLDTLSAQTGLSREELLSRLSRELPRAVDGMTPKGRLPTRDDSDWL